MIYLAMVSPNGQETHIKWKGHETVDSARTELSTIRSIMIKEHKQPYNCYVYESEEPKYGYKAHELDDVDMNFYEEKQYSSDLNKVQSNLADAIREVGILAKEEEKKYGAKK